MLLPFVMLDFGLAVHLPALLAERPDDDASGPEEGSGAEQQGDAAQV